ncbi:MAG: nucleotide sugar dehydrogenase [Pseudomonadota bacterium]
MKIAMIGTGYVGLVSGVCFSDFGHEVVCVDKAARKIEMLEAGEVPIYEPGLDVLMAKNVEAGRLFFTTDLDQAVAEADAVFIAVGTPTRRGDGHADLTYVMAAAEEIARAMVGYTVVVTKSTVPVGTNRQVKQTIARVAPEADFDVASNPEFLREGAAIDDFMRPDRVVVGVQSERAGAVMEEIYRPLFLRDFPIVTTDLESAEMIKYAARSDLLVILTEWNEFRALDLKRLARKMATAHMADLRNIYSAKDSKRAGFTQYTSVGRQGVMQDTGSASLRRAKAKEEKSMSPRSRRLENKKNGTMTGAVSIDHER